MKKSESIPLIDKVNQQLNSVVGFLEQNSDGRTIVAAVRGELGISQLNLISVEEMRTILYLLRIKKLLIKLDL